VKKIKGAVSADDSKRFTKEVSQLGICTISLHPHLQRDLSRLCCIVVVVAAAQVETTTEKHVEKIAQLMTAKEKEILAA
jgi:hypothetical protein